MVLAPGPTAIDITPKQDGGVLKEIIKEGTDGEKLFTGCNVFVHYDGKFTDGTEFDSSRKGSQPFSFAIGKGLVIKAWDIGIATMKRGETARFFCREDYAYGKLGSPPKIPPEATLVFEVEMIDWETLDLSPKKDKGILKYPIEEGEGTDSPNEGSTVEVHLIGNINDKVFDERDVTFCLGEGIEELIPPGVEKALEHFHLNEKAKLELKPNYGFGASGCEKFGVPPDSPLVYIVTLKSFQKIKDTWLMESKEKLEHGKMFKEKGTNYYKAEKFQLALKMYKKMIKYLEYNAGFEEDIEPERKANLLASHLNISMCYLKLGNCLAAKNQCDKALKLDSKNVKALFRRGQAFLGMNEPEAAKRDFDTVLSFDPSNKAAISQISVCQSKIKEMRCKEKQIYGNMFEKYNLKKDVTM
ncbi:hypothetical protein AAG570_005298 [Ranatra chinensis]|uniref:peptidylprolyl isomerase n=1 Tax=Ranatra chinensis TaxID=642074 RepID=A0ABD0Y0B9_9HEMI